MKKRKKLPIRFTVIPESIRANRELTPAARRIFGLLQFFRDRGQNSTCAEVLASAGRMSRKTVSRAIRQLEEQDLIAVGRELRTTNTYKVKRVHDKDFLCVDLQIEGTPAQRKIYSYIKFRIGENGVAWLKQTAIAIGTGCSLRTVQLALKAIEARGGLKIQHVNGGKKQVQRYGLGCQQVGQNCARDVESRAQKCPTKDNTFKEVKRNTAFFASQRGLSEGKRDISKRVQKRGIRVERQRNDDSRRKVYDWLIARPVGMRPAQAERIVFDLKVPIPAIKGLIINMAAKVDHLIRTDRFAAGQFNRAGYIVNGVRNMINEAKATANLSAIARQQIERERKTERYANRPRLQGVSLDRRRELIQSQCKALLQGVA